MGTCYENAAFSGESCDEKFNEADTRIGVADGVQVLQDGHTTTVTSVEAVDTFPNGFDTKGKIGDRTSICSRGRSLLYRRRGLILATGAAFFFSVENMFMELTTLHLNIFQASASMGAMVIFLTFLCAIVSKLDFPKNKVQYFSLVFSGLCLAVGLPLVLESLKHIEVGDSITIIYTMPIFAGIFSWILLREPLRVIDFFFALISFAGVILVARPPFIFRNDDEVTEGENPLLGALYALASAVSYALLVVAARKQSFLGLHPVIILLFNSIVVLVSNAVVCTSLHQWQVPSAEAWGYLVGLSFSDFFAQILIYMAVVVEVAMYVSIISTSEVILTFLWQFIFLSIVPEWTSAIGAVLIIGACVGMATKKETVTDESTEMEERLSKGEPIVLSISAVVNDGLSLDE